MTEDVGSLKSSSTSSEPPDVPCECADVPNVLHATTPWGDVVLNKLVGSMNPVEWKGELSLFNESICPGVPSDFALATFGLACFSNGPGVPASWFGRILFMGTPNCGAVAPLHVTSCEPFMANYTADFTGQTCCFIGPSYPPDCCPVAFEVTVTE